MQGAKNVHGTVSWNGDPSASASSACVPIEIDRLEQEHMNLMEALR